MKEVKVGLFTPYLINDPVELYGEEFNEKGESCYDANYDANNFRNIASLKTGDKIVLLENYKGIGADNATDARSQVMKLGLDFMVAGSTPPFERGINALKGTGLIIARYSTFYGGRSRYTDNTAAEGGYAIDLPKNILAVKSLLTHDGFLEGILNRDEEQIRAGLDDLSTKLDEPVLATDYLTEACKYQH